MHPDEQYELRRKVPASPDECVKLEKQGLLRWTGDQHNPAWEPVEPPITLANYKRLEAALAKANGTSANLQGRQCWVIRACCEPNLPGFLYFECLYHGLTERGAVIEWCGKLETVLPERVNFNKPASEKNIRTTDDEYPWGPK